MPSTFAGFPELIAAAHRGSPLVEQDSTARDTAEAVAEQQRIAAVLGAKAGGWKVAINPEFGPVGAPLFDPLIRASPASWLLSSELYIEVEIAVRLVQDLPPGQHSRASVIAAIGSMSVGVEMVRSRLAAGFRAPFLTFLADNLGNAGYVIGAESIPWTEVELPTRWCRVTQDDETLFDQPSVHPLGDPLAPLVAFASHQRGAHGGLNAGQIITTGSVCGMIPILKPGLVHTEIEGIGRVEIAIT